MNSALAPPQRTIIPGVRIVENFKSSREAGAWQPSQNVAFLIIAGAMILGGVLVFIL